MAMEHRRRRFRVLTTRPPVKALGGHAGLNGECRWPSGRSENRVAGGAIILLEVEATILGISEPCRLAIGVEARGVSCLFPIPGRRRNFRRETSRRPLQNRKEFNEKYARGQRFPEFLGARKRGCRTPNSWFSPIGRCDLIPNTVLLLPVSLHRGRFWFGAHA